MRRALCIFASLSPIHTRGNEARVFVSRSLSLLVSLSLGSVHMRRALCIFVSLSLGCVHTMGNEARFCVFVSLSLVVSTQLFTMCTVHPASVAIELRGEEDGG